MVLIHVTPACTVQLTCMCTAGLLLQVTTVQHTRATFDLSSPANSGLNCRYLCLQQTWCRNVVAPSLSAAGSAHAAPYCQVSQQHCCLHGIGTTHQPHACPRPSCGGIPALSSVHVLLLHLLCSADWPWQRCGRLRRQQHVWTSHPRRRPAPHHSGRHVCCCPGQRQWQGWRWPGWRHHEAAEQRQPVWVPCRRLQQPVKPPGVMCAVLGGNVKCWV